MPRLLRCCGFLQTPGKAGMFRRYSPVREIVVKGEKPAIYLVQAGTFGFREGWVERSPGN